MDAPLLLAQLRALLERAPDFNEYSATSRDHSIWLGQAHTLIALWDRKEAAALKVAADTLSIDLTRPHSIGTIYGILDRAVANLEMSVPEAQQTTFRSGEVYDFFREFNKVIESTDNSIFVIDPYIDHTIFDFYLNSRKSSATVRLLLTKNATSVKAAAQRYSDQYGNVVELRTSQKIHDRVVFIDEQVCWIIGQSLKDAAKAKPTYLAPLSADVVSEKLNEYETIWASANAI